MNIETITAGAFATNCYLVWSDRGPSSLLVDCAGEAGQILRRASRLSLTIETIVITHGHIDHLESLAELKRRTGGRIAIHQLDAAMLSDPMTSGAALFGLSQRSASADVLLAEGDSIELEGGSLGLSVLHTPGHSPGSICLLGDGVLFSGDCLFAGSIGRMDLPGGDEAAMARSLRRLATLDPGLAVYPGHGPPTTIGEEIAHNPFLGGVAG
ncbi:MAG: MBL fold metallo-hydrolase [Armatimonadota bacterium]